MARSTRKDNREGTNTLSKDGVLRLACYSRYSSLMQEDGYSIEAQHHALQQEIEARERAGQQVSVTYFDEPAQSAHVETIAERPVFSRMLKEAEAGTYDLVLVHKMDRFSRRLKVTTEAMERLQAARVGLYSIYERFDLTNPAGWLTAHLFAVLADFYSRNLGAEIKKGKDGRARAGLHGCRVPFGYRWVAEKTPAEPDSREGENVGDVSDGVDTGDWAGLMEIYRLMRQGLTDAEISSRMNRDGRWHLSTISKARTSDGALDLARPFTRNAIGAIRRNLFYRPWVPGDTRGTVEHNGDVYRGQHPAALTWEEWHSFQTAATSRRRGWTGRNGDALGIEHSAEFRGIAVCASCGGRLYVRRCVHKPHTPEQAIYERYVCQASDRQGGACADEGLWARVEDVRAQWLAWVRTHLAIPHDGERAIRRYAEAAIRAESPEHGELVLVPGHVERIECIERVERATTADGVGDEDPEVMLARRTRQVAADIARQGELRRRVTQAWLDGDIDDGEKARRLAQIEAKLGELQERQRTLAETPERRVARLVDAARIVTDVADIWERTNTEHRIRLASLLLPSGGLVVRCTGAKGQANRWYNHKPMSAELVRVQLKPEYEQLRRVAETIFSEVG